MTDEELKVVKCKLRIIKNKHFGELWKDYCEVVRAGELCPWEELRSKYITITKADRKSKWRQRDLEEQIAEEKNENPSIEE